jgi:uncharacterized protein (UPF0332 family)
MSFDWLEFYSLSKSLINDQISQDLTVSKYRTSISRAYYAAYNLSKEYLETFCKIDFDSAEILTIKKELKYTSHSIIYKIMQTSNDTDVRVGGSKLATLHSKRIDADYHANNIENIKDKAIDSVRLADIIIKCLQNIQDGKASVNIESLIRMI